MSVISRDSMLVRTLSGAAGGLVLGVVVAVVSRLDNRLVNAYRADRALPYRVVFFGILFVAAVLAGRRGGEGRGVVRAIMVGAVSGYVSGFLTWWVIQSLYVSVGSALVAITQFPGGLIASLTVPLLTFSWVFGAIVFGGAHVFTRLGVPVRE